MTNSASFFHAPSGQTLKLGRKRPVADPVRRKLTFGSYIRKALPAASANTIYSATADWAGER